MPCSPSCMFEGILLQLMFLATFTASCKSSFVVKNLWIRLMAVSALFDFKMQWAICYDHWSFWSKITPNILIVFLDKIETPLIFTLIGAASLAWNKHRSVLVSFTFIPDFFSQFGSILVYFARSILSLYFMQTIAYRRLKVYLQA